MYHIEQSGGLLGLVRLELTDHVQRHVRIVRAQGRPFVGSFANTILTEMAVALLQQRPDFIGRTRLGHCDQIDGVIAAARSLCGGGNILLDGGKGGRIVHGPGL